MNCQLLAGALSNSDQRFDVVAKATDSRQVVEATRQYQRNVALISRSLENGPIAGLTALQELRWSGSRLVMMVKRCDPA